MNKRCESNVYSLMPLTGNTSSTGTWGIQLLRKSVQGKTLFFWKAAGEIPSKYMVSLTTNESISFVKCTGKPEAIQEPVCWSERKFFSQVSLETIECTLIPAMLLRFPYWWEPGLDKPSGNRELKRDSSPIISSLTNNYKQVTLKKDSANSKFFSRENGKVISHHESIEG